MTNICKYCGCAHAADGAKTTHLVQPCMRCGQVKTIFGLFVSQAGAPGFSTTLTNEDNLQAEVYHALFAADNDETPAETHAQHVATAEAAATTLKRGARYTAADGCGLEAACGLEAIVDYLMGKMPE